MSILRYLKDKDGLRAYVIFLEEMTPTKRNRFASTAKDENPRFVEKALSCVLTFERFTQLPDMELTEVLAGVAPKMIAYAIKSLDDKARERVQKLIPTSKRIEVKSYEADNPSVAEQNTARFSCIKHARELEKKGLLKSIQIPNIQIGEFTS